MLLSYGLTQGGGRDLRPADRERRSPTVRDRAWFFLAKIRYQRGYLRRGRERARRRSRTTLPGALRGGARSCSQANLLMARGDYAGAADIAERHVAQGAAARATPATTSASPCSARGDAAQHRRGMAILDDVGRMPAENEEFRSLARPGQRRARLRRPGRRATRRTARSYLERVRLKSLQSNKALLGFGWAADSLKDPQARARAVARARRPRRRRLGGARGAHRRALRLRRARRLRPGARAATTPRSPPSSARARRSSESIDAIRAGEAGSTP